MRKSEVTLNELIAGALLKFGRVDSIDMILLMYLIKDSVDIVNNSYNHNYFFMSDGIIKLNEEYTKRLFIAVDNDMFLDRLQGNVVRNYLNDLDVSEFLLRKIKLLGSINVENYRHFFSSSQISLIDMLRDKGYVCDKIIDGSRIIKITKKGELSLFLVDNHNEIDKFRKELQSNGYDDILLEAFLITQDLDKWLKDILTIENFLVFCDNYDKCPYKFEYINREEENYNMQKKEKVAFDQLVAGLVLKFGKFDGVDLRILIDGISDTVDIVLDGCEDMSRYFITGDGSIVLNQEYVSKVYKTLNDKTLDRIQGGIVREYLDNLDLSEFVLRKIDLLGSCCVATKMMLIDNFSIIQLFEMKRLCNNGYVTEYWHETSSIYDDYNTIKVTQEGKSYLYLIDNEEEVSLFSEKLKSLGYDIKLIDDFLLLQDLSKHPGDILTIENFLDFCNNNDRSPYPSGRKRMRISN